MKVFYLEKVGALDIKVPLGKEQQMFHVQYLCRGKKNPKFDEKDYIYMLFLVNALFSMISGGTCKNKKQDSFYKKVYIDQAWEVGKHTSVVGHNAMLWHFGAVTP